VIEYQVNKPITVEQFRSVLRASTLGERRPIDDETCLRGMLEHGNLAITAWEADKLIGIARSVTDFHYCCYVSDLAVDINYQKQGIGRALLKRTQAQLEPSCMIILLSAPAAVDYYPRIGFQRHPQAYQLQPAGKIQ
jgi:ribosomal protein S18 acetylase RimI-like enzyme